MFKFVIVLILSIPVVRPPDILVDKIDVGQGPVAPFILIDPNPDPSGPGKCGNNPACGQCYQCTNTGSVNNPVLQCVHIDGCKVTVHVPLPVPTPTPSQVRYN